MVFVSSVSGLLAHPHHAPYATTKGGMNQMLRVMAREWARHGVCSGLSPATYFADILSLAEQANAVILNSAVILAQTEDLTRLCNRG